MLLLLLNFKDKTFLNQAINFRILASFTSVRPLSKHVWLNLRRYFDFGPVANTKCQIAPLSRKFEFPVHDNEQLIQIFCSRDGFGNSIGNSTKVKILSEIKPPLVLTGGKQNKLNYLIIFISDPDRTILLFCNYLALIP
jgi:hypothetical protein